MALEYNPDPTGVFILEIIRWQTGEVQRRVVSDDKETLEVLVKYAEDAGYIGNIYEANDADRTRRWLENVGTRTFKKKWLEDV